MELVARHERAFALIACWAAAAFAISLSESLANVPSSLLLGGSIVLAVVIFFVLTRYSYGFNRFILSLDLSLVTVLQSARTIGGSALLYLTYRGWIPGSFGIQAGVGDLLVAATAPLVAYRLDRSSERGKRIFFWWHIAALLDLAISVALGSLASPVPGVLAEGASSQIISRFPFTMIPLFVGPMLISLHLVALTRSE